MSDYILKDITVREVWEMRRFDYPNPRSIFQDAYCCLQCDCVPPCNTYHDSTACCEPCTCTSKKPPEHCNSSTCRRCEHPVGKCFDHPCKCGCMNCSAIRFNAQGESIDMSKHLQRHLCEQLHCCLKMQCCIGGPVGQLDCVHRDSIHECCIRLLRLPA